MWLFVERIIRATCSPETTGMCISQMMTSKPTCQPQGFGLEKGSVDSRILPMVAARACGPSSTQIHLHPILVNSVSRICHQAPDHPSTRSSTHLLRDRIVLGNKNIKRPVCTMPTRKASVAFWTLERRQNGVHPARSRVRLGVERHLALLFPHAHLRAPFAEARSRSGPDSTGRRRAPQDIRILG